MNLNATNEQNIIERDIHCPFCQSDKALLISGLAVKSSSLLWPPAYGLKYALSVVFTMGIHMITNGFPFIEKKRSYEFNTYGFCPHCGKTYNAGAPATVKAVKAPKFYKSLRQKKIMGVCGGIAEYTGLSVKVVRLTMFLQGIVLGVPYIVFGLIADVNPNQRGE